jgi:hypothetical protein
MGGASESKHTGGRSNQAKSGTQRGLTGVGKRGEESLARGGPIGRWDEEMRANGTTLPGKRPSGRAMRGMIHHSIATVEVKDIAP